MSEWCRQHGVCEIVGSGAFTGDLARGQTARIPIAQFSADLGQRQGLQLYYAEVFYDPPPQAEAAIVAIDGTEGIPISPLSVTGLAGVIFEWSPFPSSPNSLDVRFDDGGEGSVFVRMRFLDFACEQANPDPGCAE